MNNSIREKYYVFAKETINKSSLSPALKNALTGEKKLVFYGAGMQALFLLDFCVLIGRDVACALVSDAAKVGEARFERKKVPVFTIEDFSAQCKEKDFCVIVAVNEKFNAEIGATLHHNGIDSAYVVASWKNENAELEKITLTLRAYMLENSLLKRVINGVVSVQNGSFKRYLLENNMPEKISRLKEGLDASSLQILERCFFKMLQNPEDWLGKFWLLSVPEYENTFMTEEDRRRMKKCTDNAAQYENKFSIGTSPAATEEFLFHHGLFLADDAVKRYIQGKDFLDCGSYDGLSALVFDAFYQPRKIYSFDLSQKNCALYEHNMRMNGVSPERYEMIHCGISDVPGVSFINDSGGSGVSLGRFSKQNSVENETGGVPLTSIDDFVNARAGLHVGFIKCDLEGHGLKALQGMEQTIRRFRPVLNLAIYHCPEEFFEMKPLLEKFTKNMNYHITIVENSPLCHELLEVCLFACPAAE